MKAPKDPGERLKFFYNQMLAARRLEEKIAQMYGDGHITGFCHLYIGQEAVVAGGMAALDPRDNAISAYREHPHPLLKGSDANLIMAELFGRKDGLSKGKGGSMHLFDIENRFWGGHGIVGGHVPLATGLAFASKYKKEDRVTLCYFGDGATNQGVFDESLNYAATWKLPIVFICENNGYGMGTAISRTTVAPEIHMKAHGYNMPHFKIDGMDVEVVYKAVKEAVDLARADNFPSLIDAVTYRYKGHSMSDPAVYRSKEEVDEFKERDPIKQVEKKLREKKLMSDEDFKKEDAKIKKQMNDAVDFALKSPYPEYEEIFTDIYSE